MHDSIKWQYTGGQRVHNTYIHTHKHTHQQIHSLTHTLKHTNTPRPKHTHKHIHTYTHTHTPPHTHTNTHKVIVPRTAYTASQTFNGAEQFLSPSDLYTAVTSLLFRVTGVNMPTALAVVKKSIAYTITYSI